MTKTRFLALVTALALLLAIPTSVFAQNAKPHVFVGTATLDGATAADGAAVTAWVGGEQVAATTVKGGEYDILVGDSVGYAGETVSFKLSGAVASETAACPDFVRPLLLYCHSLAQSIASSDCSRALRIRCHGSHSRLVAQSKIARECYGLHGCRCCGRRSRRACCRCRSRW